MNIYAIRDRMLDYYLAPFAASKDQDVLAALSQRISNDDDKDSLAQAPHHFEIWCLGKVTDEGELISAPELLAECSSLIRARRKPSTSRGSAIPSAHEGINRPPLSPAGAEAASKRAAARQVESKDQLRAAPAGASRRSDGVTLEDTDGSKY